MASQDLECANCTGPFEQRAKGYLRHSLGSKITGTDTTISQALENVIKTLPITPNKARQGRYMCNECYKLLGSLARYQTAYDSFMRRMKPCSYVTRKRVLSTPTQTPQKKKVPRCTSVCKICFIM